MDNDIFSHFPDRETFDRYWNENYVPVTYEDVADAEGAIYERELTDILDILQEVLREAKSGRRVK